MATKNFCSPDKRRTKMTINAMIRKRVVLCMAIFLGISSRQHSTASAFVSNHHGAVRLQLVSPIAQQMIKKSSQMTHRQTDLLMSLIPLEVPEIQRLLSTRAPTAQQYASYFGRSARERYDRLVETAIVSVLGTTFSYFMSFVLGSFVATIFGTLFLFWGVLSPELKAYQRNWEFIGGRRLVDPVYENDYDGSDDGEYKKSPRGLYGALFVGRLDRVCVVEDAQSPDEYSLDDFLDYNMDNDELEKLTGDPYLLRVACVDTTGRTLQVHARMSPEYLDLDHNMAVVAVLLSTSSQFSTLAALTDLYVPYSDVWIGDYPYLDRAELQVLLEDDEQVFEALQLEEDATGLYDLQGADRTPNKYVDGLAARQESAANNDDDCDDAERNDPDLVLARRRRQRRYR